MDRNVSSVTGVFNSPRTLPQMQPRGTHLELHLTGVTIVEKEGVVYRGQWV